MRLEGTNRDNQSALYANQNLSYKLNNTAFLEHNGKTYLPFQFELIGKLNPSGVNAPYFPTAPEHLAYLDHLTTLNLRVVLPVLPDARATLRHLNI